MIVPLRSVTPDRLRVPLSGVAPDDMSARFVVHLLEGYIQLHRLCWVGGTVLALEDMFDFQR